MRKIFILSLIILVTFAINGCSKTDDDTISSNIYCKDCGAEKPEYCVTKNKQHLGSANLDEATYYCSSCYWENHSFEKNVYMMSYDKWWE